MSGLLPVALSQAVTAVASETTIGHAVLGLGGGLIAWLLSRQIAQLDKHFERLDNTTTIHEKRLNRHGKSIAVLKAMSSVPIKDEPEDNP